MQASLGLQHTEQQIKLRPYQEECIASIPDTGSYIIQMAVGLGKTVTFSRIPRRGRMLIISHREELVTQPRKYFQGCTFGIEKARQHSSNEEVVSASIQSIVRRLDKFRPDDFDIIITDEAHHAVADSYRKVYDYFTPRLHLGFTATPNRFDGVGLENVFEDIIFERDLEWGIKNGYLSDIECLRVNIGINLAGVRERMGDYAADELESTVNIHSANKTIAEAYRKYAKGQTLIFACSIDHARAIAAEIPGSVPVIGGEDRSEILEKFRRGEITTMTNCMVFTEGTDLPNIETIIVARPTKNISLYTQIVGRGTRLSPGKEKLRLIDCVGNDMNMCCAPSLLGLDVKAVPKPEKIVGDLFELGNIMTQEADKPEYWIKNVEYVSLWAKNKKYNLHDVNYFKMPNGTMLLSTPKMVIPAEDSLGRILWNSKKMPAQKVFDEVFKLLRSEHDETRYIWDLKIVNRWGASAASEKQKSLVQRVCKGYDVANLTKSEANQILTRSFYNKHGSKKTKKGENQNGYIAVT